MVDKKNPKSNDSDLPDDGAGNTGPVSGGSESNDEFIAAEGPDVEVGSDDPGFSPEDLSFLNNLSAGAAPAPAPEVNEHLADLKRISAEYANYRKRTEANRDLDKALAVGEVAKILLPVLDDLDRAEKHGDLVEGPFQSIAAKLRAGVERLGLTAYGEAGEAFDPAIHEAIFQQPSSAVTEPTVADVVERGYRLGDRVQRVARVVVATPEAS